MGSLTFNQRGKIYGLLKDLPNTDLVFTWDNGDKIKLADLPKRENGRAVFLDTRSPKALPFDHARILIDAMVKLAEGDWQAPDSDQVAELRERLADPAPITVDPEWVRSFAPPVSTPAVKTAESVPAELGLYMVDGFVYRVKASRSNPDRRYASLIGNMERGYHKARMAKGMVFRLTEADRMTADQAKAYGDKFGQCCNCGKGLTDPTSVKLGIGPVCRKGLRGFAI